MGRKTKFLLIVATIASVFLLATVPMYYADVGGSWPSEESAYADGDTEEQEEQEEDDRIAVEITKYKMILKVCVSGKVEGLLTQTYVPGAEEILCSWEQLTYLSWLSQEMAEFFETTDSGTILPGLTPAYAWLKISVESVERTWVIFDQRVANIPAITEVTEWHTFGPSHVTSYTVRISVYSEVIDPLGGPVAGRLLYTSQHPIEYAEEGV